MMTAEQYWLTTYKDCDGELIYQHSNENSFKFAEAYAAAQLAEKERLQNETYEAFSKADDERERQWRRAEAAEQRLKEAQAEIARYRNQIDLMHRRENGEVWYWADDSEDHPESLACPALIQPDVVRRFVAAETRLRQREAELEQRWIAVGERMPGDGVTVLTRQVRANGDEFTATTSHFDAEWFTEDQSYKKQPEVTHWQPLPSPPKEAK